MRIWVLPWCIDGKLVRCVVLPDIRLEVTPLEHELLGSLMRLFCFVLFLSVAFSAAIVILCDSLYPFLSMYPDDRPR